MELWADCQRVSGLGGKGIRTEGFGFGLNSRTELSSPAFRYGFGVQPRLFTRGPEPLQPSKIANLARHDITQVRVHLHGSCP